MGLFSDDHEYAGANAEVYGTEGHKGHWPHKLIGGAAAFEAAKLYEDKRVHDGQPENHLMAKELIAGIAGAEVDKLFESKGLDFIDLEKAKNFARRKRRLLLMKTTTNYSINLVPGV
ncbi:hypothetical protein DTO027I6_9814 [Penicillium roqueforti]|nr:hypothetical protein CBS147337_9893 [Penicillium roqueforti]KAI3185298.1 hypothetical protein DTO027I6_9814 [Penicillium roqueforti]